MKRIREGMIEEVKKLHASGLSYKKLDSFGLEYRYVSRYIQGKISKEEMIETLKKEIWRYAKRQMTWFKRDPRIAWVSNVKMALRATKRFLA